MSFVVGDRVRVTGNECDSPLYAVGDEGVVSAIDSADPTSVVVALDSGVSCWFVASGNLASAE